MKRMVIMKETDDRDLLKTVVVSLISFFLFVCCLILSGVSFFSIQIITFMFVVILNYYAESKFKSIIKSFQIENCIHEMTNRELSLCKKNPKLTDRSISRLTNDENCATVTVGEEHDGLLQGNKS
jgi:hypothetical protein